MFRLGRVGAAELERIARESESAVPTYADLGASLTGSLLFGYRHDRYEARLPDRPDAFDRAREGLRQWVAHIYSGLSVQPLEPPREGATVAVGSPLGPLTAVAICRVVTLVDEQDTFGFAYGTLPGHPEQGEESFLVKRAAEGVTFTVVAFSKPVELLARLGGPITRAVQQRATRRYLDALVAFVATDT